MANSTVWWLVAGGLVAVELVSGTVYLLLLGAGCAAAALVAHAGIGPVGQIVTAAGVGVGAVGAWHAVRRRRPGNLPSEANRDVNLDIGERLQVDAWNADGTAQVRYRGALWTVVPRPGVVPSTGAHRVAEVVGNRLVVDKI